jgi:hypothetical protein
VENGTWLALGLYRPIQAGSSAIKFLAESLIKARVKPRIENVWDFEDESEFEHMKSAPSTSV